MGFWIFLLKMPRNLLPFNFQLGKNIKSHANFWICVAFIPTLLEYLGFEEYNPIEVIVIGFEKKGLGFAGDIRPIL